MSRFMFVFATLATVLMIGILVLAVLSFTGAFVNPFIDPGM